MSELQITTQQAMPHTAGRPVVEAPVVGAGASVPEIKPSVITAPDPVEVQRQVAEAVQWLNQQVEKLGRSVGFSVDNVAGRNVVTVRDKSSGEVVRQFPDEAILRVAPNVRIVATSREALHVPGEQSYPLNPLPLPSRDVRSEQLMQSPAVGD